MAHISTAWGPYINEQHPMQASTQGDIIHSTISFMYGLGDVVTGVTCSIHLQRQAVEDVVCHGTKCSWQQQKGHAITNCSVSPSHRIIAHTLHVQFISSSQAVQSAHRSGAAAAAKHAATAAACCCYCCCCSTCCSCSHICTIFRSVIQ